MYLTRAFSQARTVCLSTQYNSTCPAYTYSIISVKHNLKASWPTSQLTPTSVSSCFFPTQQVEEKEERRSGLSEASHYYGNMAHKAQLCTDSGCHGYGVWLLHRQGNYSTRNRTKRRRQLSLVPLNYTKAGL